MRTGFLVVATVQSGDSGATSALEAWKAGLIRTGQLGEIELAPLNEDATLALAERVAGRAFDRALAPLPYQASEGYPLFIVEMVRAGFGRITPAPPPAAHTAAMLATRTPLTAKVSQVLETRLAQLSSPARGLVELASVIGRAFTYSVLARATDLSEALLIGCLDECWRKRIIREQGEAAFDFSHDKLREVAYAGLSRTRRRWLHGRVAGALESLHAADLDRAAGIIAGHYEAAGLATQAIAYYGRAAATARRVYANHEALIALETAIRLLDGLPADAARREQAGHLNEGAGDLRALLAQHGLARDAYAAALACTPDNESIVRARLYRKIGKTLESEQAGYTQVVAQYETAEALLGPPDDQAGSAWWEEWFQVQLDRLILLYWWGRREEMAERTTRVEPQVKRHGTPVQRACFFASLNRQLNQSNRFAPSEPALDYARAAVQTFPPSAGPELRGPYQFVLGFNLLWHGLPTDAEAALQEALDMAELTGDVALETRCLAYLTVDLRRQGRDADVEVHARWGLALAEAAGMPEYIGSCRANLAWVAWRRAGVPRANSEAEQLAQNALKIWGTCAAPYPFYWQALWPLIGIALAQGRAADAVGYVRRLCDPGQQALPSRLEEPLEAALTAWEAGKIDEAGDLLRRALDLAQEMNFS